MPISSGISGNPAKLSEINDHVPIYDKKIFEYNSKVQIYDRWCNVSAASNKKAHVSEPYPTTTRVSIMQRQKSSRWKNVFHSPYAVPKNSPCSSDATDKYLNSCPEIKNINIPTAVDTIAVMGYFATELQNKPKAITNPLTKNRYSNPP